MNELSNAVSDPASGGAAVVPQTVAGQFNPVDGPPKPLKPRAGLAAEYKLAKLRDCPMENTLCERPEEAYLFWRRHIADASWMPADQEACCVIMLSTRRRVIGFHLVSVGTIDTSLVHPRELFKTALVSGANAIIIMHNHPSGDPTPSESDIAITRNMIRAGQLLKCEVLDHVIAGQEGKVTPGHPGYCSLRELGYFYS